MPGRTWKLPPDVEEALSVAADSLDMNQTAVLVMLIRGAAHGGHLERFVEAGAIISERRGLPMARMGRQQAGVGHDLWLPVEPTHYTGPGGGIASAKDWVRGPWRLSYHGDSRRARVRTPGDGWHLTGPGLDVALHVGWKRDDAYRTAARIIERHEAGGTATGAA